MTYNARRIENKKLENTIREIKTKASPPTKFGKLFGRIFNIVFFVNAYYESYKECERQGKAWKERNENKL
jgi:hypothetical protein